MPAHPFHGGGRAIAVRDALGHLRQQTCIFQHHPLEHENGLLGAVGFFLQNAQLLFCQDHSRIEQGLLTHRKTDHTRQAGSAVVQPVDRPHDQPFGCADACESSHGTSPPWDLCRLAATSACRNSPGAAAAWADSRIQIPAPSSNRGANRRQI